MQRGKRQHRQSLLHAQGALPCTCIRNLRNAQPIGKTHVRLRQIGRQADEAQQREWGGRPLWYHAHLSHTMEVKVKKNELMIDAKQCLNGCRSLTLLPGAAAAVTLAECVAIMASRSAYSLRCTYVTWSQNIRARRWYLHVQLSFSSSEMVPIDA